MHVKCLACGKYSRNVTFYCCTLLHYMASSDLPGWVLSVGCFTATLLPSKYVGGSEPFDYNRIMLI